KAHRATGYWGLGGYTAVTDPEKLPSWLLRDEIGTSVLSVGFHQDEHWQEHMAVSMTANFFAAVFRGKLVVEVGDGQCYINQHTIRDRFEDPDLAVAASDLGMRD